jgi:7-cyano-7-deazaguanine synthase
MACAIIGALAAESIDHILTPVWNDSIERGRDAWGVTNVDTGTRWSIHTDKEPDFRDLGCFLGNRRAEPTTEWVKDKTELDTQPFHTPGGWNVVHNGTIANDKDLVAALQGRTGWFPPRTSIDTEAVGIALDVFTQEGQSHLGAVDLAVRSLRGSFALLMAHDSDPGTIWYAVNYKPLWIADVGGGIVVASQRHYFPDRGVYGIAPQEVPPYTMGRITLNGGMEVLQSLYAPRSDRVLVVCSGGLDSTVAATKYVREGADVTLLHLMYGARAEGQEVLSVKEIASTLGCKAQFLATSFFQQNAQSTLTDPDAEIVTGFGGEEGAEYGHEWVPARNTVMIALALAYAEANEFDILVLGNNLEESGGGYPDNEQEFINRWNDLIPFAVKPYANIVIEQPLGSLMKHEIVAMGITLDAPFDATWSCYSGGDHHCGTCGPCFMRRTAFEMNGAVDPVMR